MRRTVLIASLLAGLACTAANAGDAAPAGGTPGKGFHVVGAKLYDPSGAEVRLRGVNHGHWDQTGGYTGVPLSGANAERMLLEFTRSPAGNLAIVRRAVDAGLVAIPSNWKGTCKPDPASLERIVDTWVDQAATWTQLNDVALINIANEWGPGDSVVWRDEYVKAIARMREAGYTGTLVVDSGGCGQNLKDLLTWGADVLASDPLHNILFDVHIYGGFYDPVSAHWQQAQEYATALSRLKATGLAIVIGEFGPGRKVGPSPTLLTPERIVADAEANGFGWLAWSWDDNNLPGCQSNDGWFSMTVNCGKYTGRDDELTMFGRTVVSLLKKYGATHANFGPR